MSDNYFLDTNVFVYSFDRSTKGETAKKLISNGLSSQRAKISYQVVQEFINVSTRKFKEPLTIGDLRIYVPKVLQPLWTVYSSPKLIQSALDIKERWLFGYYDSLIIAAAIEANCSKLYSEDLQHGQKVYDLEIINPFIQV